MGTLGSIDLELSSYYNNTKKGFPNVCSFVGCYYHYDKITWGLKTSSYDKELEQMKKPGKTKAMRKVHWALVYRH